MLGGMSGRLPAPGPSFVLAQTVRSDDRGLRAGIGEPATMADDWWVSLLWVADDDGLVSFRDLGPSAGPPPDPPLLRLGPLIAGALSGMILEEGGRQMLRLRMGAPPQDERLPWEAPFVVLSAFRWEPMRAATMDATELATTVLTGFRRSVEGLARP
jgi:hypothetical protein